MEPSCCGKQWKEGNEVEYEHGEVYFERLWDMDLTIGNPKVERAFR